METNLGMLRSPDKQIHYIFCLFVWIFLSPFSAFSASLSMDYSLGFNGRFQIKNWTPLTITLENTGRTISGTLEVQVTSGSEYRQDVHQTIYSMDVELPYNSKKLCTFTILITSVTHQMVIRLKQAGKILVSKSLNLRHYYTTNPIALVLGNKISPDFLAMLPRSIFPVHVRPRFLPETWFGYDGVKVVIMSPETMKNMRERQFQALAKWVKQGGFIVTAGGINTGSLLEKRPMHFLPIEVLGHIKFFELKSLEYFCDQKLIAADPFLVLNVNIENSDILLREDDIPIIIQKKIGIGKIIFISFDFHHPPFNRWTGRQIFWDKILSLQPSNGSKGIELDNQTIMDFMLSSIPASFPNFKLTFLFLLVYFLLLKLFFKRLEKYEGKKWKNCCYLLIVITIFSTSSYFLFFYPNNKKNLTASSFLHMNMADQNRMASGKKLIGVYSIRDNPYRLGLGSTSRPVIHILYAHSGAATPNSYLLHENNSGQHILGFSGKWSNNFFIIQLKFEFNIAGQAHVDEDGLHIMIENGTPYTIIDCLVYLGDRFFFLGNVSANTRQQKRILASDIDMVREFDSQEPEPPAENMYTKDALSISTAMQKKLLKDVLLAVHSKYKSKPETACLIGWIHADVIQTKFTNPDITSEDLTLITCEIPARMKL